MLAVVGFDTEAFVETAVGLVSATGASDSVGGALTDLTSSFSVALSGTVTGGSGSAVYAI